ncbi:MAG: tRNA guanosine(34) transglycosylase Tgt [Dehalococcoidales bacterium]|nr:tRNA guanosine(34) transglycosylase Tgt [Dehalococcoidales bacterium]
MSPVAQKGEGLVSNLNSFHLIQTCLHSKARAGELLTPHGTVPTPVFLPVGSQGAIKTLTPEEVKDVGIAMVLANTYHLYLRPGIGVIEKMGGLHKFMSWDRAILTDSGGYQIFSLAPLRRVNDEGVIFRSHIDGSQHHITPELIIQFQETLGADIIMALDECPAYDDSFEKVQMAMDRTHRWAERCQKAQKHHGQALYAIVQGGVFPQLRRQSAEYLTSLEFPGYAIGGLSIGEPKKVTQAMIDETVALLPESKPRYLMGVGSPEDIIEAVARGIDMFDSALPTRVARNGALFTWQGRHNIRNAAYSQMEQPIVPDCDCYACHNFSAAYLHHLFSCDELLAYRLATIHNLSFISNLMAKIRDAILNGTFLSFKDSFLANYQSTDEQTRLSQKQKWLKSRNLRR